MMTANLSNDRAAPPTSPARKHRGLVILVAVLGLLLAAGLAIIVGTIIYRISNTDSQQNDAPAPAGDAAAAAPPLALLGVRRPADGELVGATSSGNRLTLHFRNADGDVVVVVDLASGRVLSRVEIAGEAEDGAGEE